MKVANITYTEVTGWHPRLDPALDSPNTLIIVFGAPSMNRLDQPWQDLKSTYPASTLIGCSGAGEISGNLINDHSLSVAILRFEKTKLLVVNEPLSSAEQSYDVGAKISHKLCKDDLKGIFVLSEGINVNGSELVKGLNSATNNVVITGGLAGDGFDFNRTWTICNDKICNNHVVAVGFYGDSIEFGYASRGGWDTFGPERVITRSDKNILYELDGKPALSLYKEYLGERANGLPSTGLLFPLSIRKGTNDNNELVRTILGVDEETQSLVFAGDLPKGYLARLMKANPDRLIAAASESATEATKSKIFQNNPVAVIAISCVGRRIIMGERTEEEVQSSFESLPLNAIQLGFYSYGELCPFRSLHCDLHNQTMTLTAISER